MSMEDFARSPNPPTLDPVLSHSTKDAGATLSNSCRRRFNVSMPLSNASA